MLFRSLLQSTSPNYLLLASLDIARLQMQENPEKISQAVKISKNLRAEINLIDGLKTFDAVPNFDLDFTKVTVNVENLGFTGIDAEKILRHEFKIQCELSDAANLLFLITYADTCATIEKLVDALKNFAADKKFYPAPKRFIATPAEITQSEISPREVFFAESKAVEIENCVGKICAEEVTFYPPGIPILNPGEVITPQILNFIGEQKEIGGRIIGAADVNLNKINIFGGF